MSQSENNSDSECEEQKAPDVIADIYKSMSQIIEALNTDNLLLNRQVEKIRGDLEFVCSTLASLKMDAQEISTTCTYRNEDLSDLKKKIHAVSDLQKHVVETRNMLIQTLDTNIKTIKKELTEIRTSRDNMRPYIKVIVEEEIKIHLDRLEKKFESLERDQRMMLANHIRKSAVQPRVETEIIAQLIREELAKLNQSSCDS